MSARPYSPRVLVVSYTARPAGPGGACSTSWPRSSPGRCWPCPRGRWPRGRGAAGTTVVSLPERPLELRGGRAAAARALGGHARDVRRLVRELEPATVVAWGMRSAIAAAPAVARSDARLVVRHGDLAPSPAIARALRMACRPGGADDLRLAGDRGRTSGPWAGWRWCTRASTWSGCDRRRPPRPMAPVLLLGAIVGWKRPDLALEAVAGLPEARLRVVGEPFLDAGRRLLDDLRRRAEQPDLAGRVEFAGAVADPDAELAAASCLLHCADAEPFGRVVAEALACGLPVVAPAAGGPAELVDDSCGRLYRPGDAARRHPGAFGGPSGPRRACPRARAPAPRPPWTSATRVAATASWSRPTRRPPPRPTPRWSPSSTTPSPSCAPCWARSNVTCRGWR